MKKFTFTELEDIASAHGAYVELRPDLMPALRLFDRSLILTTQTEISDGEPTYYGFKLIGQKNVRKHLPLWDSLTETRKDLIGLTG